MELEGKTPVTDTAKVFAYLSTLHLFLTRMHRFFYHKRILETPC